MNMDNNLDKSSITNKVVEKIKKGQVKMKPKIYFILKSILLMLSLAVSALFALYLLSFIAFVLRSTGVWYLPVFGFQGIAVLLHSLPWILILMALILVAVLEILVRHFSFSYRRPILYSILAIIMLLLLGVLIVNKTQLHPALFRRAQERELPIAGRPYRDFAMPKFHNVHRGVVLEITYNGFLIETSNGEVLTVIVAPETRFPYRTSIEKNETVVILGERDDGSIRAFGIRKINDQLNISPRHPLPMPGRMPVPWD